MLVCDYIVESIDGDYAHLRRTDLPEEELKLVARALLPFEITEGCSLFQKDRPENQSGKKRHYCRRRNHFLLPYKSPA